jgi:hypothetical protein
MRNPHSLSDRFSQSRQLLLAVLLVAFGWLQFAGMVHKIVHPQQQHAHQADQVDHEHHGHSFNAWFPEHSQHNEQECQLFDLQCSEPTVSQAIATLALRVIGLQSLQNADALFRTIWRLFPEARAPPSLI